MLADKKKAEPLLRPKNQGFSLCLNVQDSRYTPVTALVLFQSPTCTRVAVDQFDNVSLAKEVFG